MCIGIVSEYGVPMPTKEVLKRCWADNSDGAGYAYLNENDTWTVQKGFMKWKDFITAFEDQKFTDENTVAIHFRIGTSGRCPSGANSNPKQGEECTHPFPISDEQEELDKTDYTAREVVLHNGVVGDGEGQLSDTQVAIRDIINTLWKYAENDTKVLDLLEELIDAGPRYKGSRWFVGHGPNYTFLGGWELDKDTKIWYTHDGYKPSASWWAEHYGTDIYGARTTPGWSGRTGSGMAGAAPWATKTTNIIVIHEQHAHSMCAGGMWCWDKWDSWRVPARINKNESVLMDEKEVGTVREVYNSSGQNIIGLVDAFGNVVWDEILNDSASEHLEEESTTEMENYECLGCGNLINDNDLDENQCPFCETVMLIETNSQLNNQAVSGTCPNCGETEHLSISGFDVGDSECHRCGAVFLDTMAGLNGIVTWNEDTKRAHDELIVMAASGGK